jgi:hypothetical protein
MVYKILVFTIAYVVLTTLFAMPFLISFAQVEQQKPFPYPVFHPSYATIVIYIGY